MSFLYFILGLCPILWLIFALTVLGWPTYKAAFGSLIISVLLSVAIWQQSFLNTMMAACEGFLMALWPIIVVIIAAVFTYNLSLRTRGMEIIKQMITSVSSDKRILVLLVAWCFGGFMEGIILLFSLFNCQRSSNSIWFHWYSNGHFGQFSWS